MDPDKPIGQGVDGCGFALLIVPAPHRLQGRTVGGSLTDFR